MQDTVFYSWQSDSPNNKNRSFIANCLEKAIKEINNENISLEVAIDRDTKDVSGTPDIVHTLFSKIDIATIFVADISFINPTSDKRKCPNPNVLIELGYAAKVLGWKKIICIFNTEYGKIEDLPFDLRFRRPLTYEFNENSKATVKKAIISTLKKEISSIVSKENDDRDLKIYLKQQVDKEIIKVTSHLYKMIYGFDKFQDEQFNRITQLSIDDLRLELFEKKIIGFTVIKDWEFYITTLNGIMNQPLFANQAGQNLNNAIIQVIKTITTLSVFQRQKEVYYNTEIDVKGFRVINGKELNAENQDNRYILVRELDEEKGKVIDSGVILKQNVDKALKYLVINDHFEKYIEAIYKLTKALENYMDKTGNILLLDPLHFRV